MPNCTLSRPTVEIVDVSLSVGAPRLVVGPPAAVVVVVESGAAVVTVEPPASRGLKPVEPGVITPVVAVVEDDEHAVATTSTVRAMTRRATTARGWRTRSTSGRMGRT